MPANLSRFAKKHPSPPKVSPPRLFSREILDRLVLLNYKNKGQAMKNKEHTSGEGIPYTRVGGESQAISSK
jgi:hypothetical protein